MIKELIKISNELDSRGLVKEADRADAVILKLAADILRFDLSKRKKPSSPKDLSEAPAKVIDLPARKQPLYSECPTLEELENDSRHSGETPPRGWSEIVENDYFKNPVLHSNGAETVVESEEIIKAFIKEYLSPETYIMSGDDILESVLYSESQELKDYMLETMPDLISDLSEKLNDGDSPNDHKEQIITQARELADYELNDDFKYIINSMIHYLGDYTF
jgi:hypothetical protein